MVETMILCQGTRMKGVAGCGSLAETSALAAFLARLPPYSTVPTKQVTVDVRSD